MNKVQDGFSIVETLVAFVIVGLIGAAGWLVHDRQRAEQPNLAHTETTVQKPETSLDASDTTIKQENKTYEDEFLTFQYPYDWLIGNIPKSENYADFATLISPDFKEPDEGDGPGSTAAAGYKLQVSVRKSESYESYESDLENAPLSQQNHGGFYESIKIDGNNAILSNTKTHGTYLHATTYKNGNTYQFTLHTVDDNKPEPKGLFKTLLDTVKLK